MYTVGFVFIYVFVLDQIFVVLNDARGTLVIPGTPRNVPQRRFGCTVNFPLRKRWGRGGGRKPLHLSSLTCLRPQGPPCLKPNRTLLHLPPPSSVPRHKVSCVPKESIQPQRKAFHHLLGPSSRATIAAVRYWVSLMHQRSDAERKPTLVATPTSWPGHQRVPKVSLSETYSRLETPGWRTASAAGYGPNAAGRHLQPPDSRFSGVSAESRWSQKPLLNLLQRVKSKRAAETPGASPGPQVPLVAPDWLISCQ